MCLGNAIMHVVHGSNSACAQQYQQLQHIARTRMHSAVGIQNLAGGVQPSIMDKRHQRCNHAIVPAHQQLLRPLPQKHAWVTVTALLEHLVLPPENIYVAVKPKTGIYQR